MATISTQLCIGLAHILRAQFDLTIAIAETWRFDLKNSWEECSDYRNCSQHESAGYKARLLRAAQAGHTDEVVRLQQSKCTPLQKSVFTGIGWAKVEGREGNARATSGTTDMRVILEQTIRGSDLLLRVKVWVLQSDGSSAAGQFDITPAGSSVRYSSKYPCPEEPPRHLAF